MKKLIIAAAAIAMSVVASAATCNWASGNMYIAAGENGGWAAGTANLVKNQGVTVNMAVFLITDTQFEQLSSASRSELWEAYGNEDITKLGIGKEVSTTLVGSNNAGAANAITVADADAASGVMYAVVVAAYHDATYNKDMYIATTAKSTYNSATGKGTAGNLISGQSATGWTAVETIPEPTSGLLLLLGMAGLALKRKHA